MLDAGTVVWQSPTWLQTSVILLICVLEELEEDPLPAPVAEPSAVADWLRASWRQTRPVRGQRPPEDASCAGAERVRSLTSIAVFRLDGLQIRWG